MFLGAPGVWAAVGDIFGAGTSINDDGIVAYDNDSNATVIFNPVTNSIVKTIEGCRGGKLLNDGHFACGIPGETPKTRIYSNVLKNDSYTGITGTSSYYPHIHFTTNLELFGACLMSDMNNARMWYPTSDGYKILPLKNLIQNLPGEYVNIQLPEAVSPSGKFIVVRAGKNSGAFKYLVLEKTNKIYVPAQAD